MTSRNVTFTMGLPGSGKSTVLGNMGILETHAILDPDAIKRTHKDYDPKSPATLHAWSQEITEEIYKGILQVKEGNFVIDGTGTNAEKMVRRMNEVSEAGYSVTLIYVKVSMETALIRNAQRDRSVPEHIIRSKADDIVTAFKLIAPHADKIEIVNND